MYYINYYLYFICVYVCVYQDNLWELYLLTMLDQYVRFSGKHPYLLSHLDCPTFFLITVSAHIMYRKLGNRKYNRTRSSGAHSFGISS